MKGCLFTVEEVSAHDRAELEKFERFIKAKASGKSERDAYVEVYGEVLFDAAAPVTAGGGK